jgi:hypothetical protein
MHLSKVNAKNKAKKISARMSVFDTHPARLAKAMNSFLWDIMGVSVYVEGKCRLSMQ